MTEIPTSGMPSRVDGVDHFVDAGDLLVLDERRELVDAPVLGSVGVRPPPAVVVLGHVEQSERDDLILIADVARVVGPLKAGWHGVTRSPRATELLPRARLQAASGEHDDHRVTSSGGWIVRVRPRCAWTAPPSRPRRPPSRSAWSSLSGRRRPRRCPARSSPAGARHARPRP